MGNGCSCGKNLIHPSVAPNLPSAKFKSKAKRINEKKEEEKNDCKSTETQQDTFKEAVKNSVDIDPCEDDETAIEIVKEYKVLPPIRNKSIAVPHISYKPDRVWGGSVNSYLDATKRNSIIDEHLITGG